MRNSLGDARAELRQYTRLLLARLGYEPCCFYDDDCGDEEFMVSDDDFAKTVKSFHEVYYPAFEAKYGKKAGAAIAEAAMGVVVWGTSAINATTPLAVKRDCRASLQRFLRRLRDDKRAMDEFIEKAPVLAAAFTAKVILLRGISL